MRRGAAGSPPEGDGGNQKLAWAEASEGLGRRLSGEASDAEVEEFKHRTLRQLSGCAPKFALAVGLILALLYVTKFDLGQLQLLVEVFSNVLLGVMAVYLSVQANTIARQQKDLAHRQTELLDRQQKLAEDQLRPRLRLRIDPIQDRELGTIPRYRIENEGGNLQEIFVMTMSAISVTLRERAGAAHKSFVLPTNFYQRPRYTQEPKGIVFENRALSVSGASMNNKLEALREALKARFEFCDISIIHFVHAYAKGDFGGTDTTVFRVPAHLWEFDQMSSFRLPYNEGLEALTSLTGGMSPIHSLSLAPVDQAVELIAKLGTGVQAQELIGHYFTMEKIERALDALEKREMEEGIRWR